MCKVEVTRTRKDSERAISKALERALGEELSEVHFRRASNGESKKGLVAEVSSTGEDREKVLSATRRALRTVSRGRSVLVFSVRHASVT